MDIADEGASGNIADIRLYGYDVGEFFCFELCWLSLSILLLL